ncbi:MAG: serine protease [Planctomycetia bacterium]|nr:serine protease [Planctomycetia bacterium]
MEKRNVGWVLAPTNIRCNGQAVGASTHPTVLFSLCFFITSLLSTPYSSAQCPGGACPIPFAPRSPRQYSAPSAQQLSSATFDTVVKLTADNQFGGSGVLVECDGHAVILTAEHVVRGAGAATVTFRDGQQLQSREILVDRGRLDLAAVVIPWPRQIQPAAIGDMPRAGDVVVACGYGSTDALLGLPNTIRGVRYSRIGTDVTEPDSLEMVGTFRSGDSGGPVFNDRQQVVAIVNASSTPGAANQSNVAVGCRPIRAFLQRLRDRLGKNKRQQPDASGGNQTPGEIAPGIAAPRVEFPSAGGCQCDNAAVLKKLDELQVEIGGRKSEVGQENSRVSGKLDELSKRIGAAATRDDVGAVAQEQASVKSAIEKWKSELLDRAPAAGMTIGKLVAGALGLSTPVGVGIGIAGWLLGRRMRRKFSGGATPRVFEVADSPEEKTSSDARPLNTRTVILETPPPPQVVERSQQFVPYQAQSARLDAIERAMAEYVRKYPSAAGVFETINVYANQFQSGEKKQE